MSEVKTYRFPDDTFKTQMRYVLASDYAKLEAEAKVLREEVTRGERHRNDQADQIVSLRTEAAALRARVVVVDEDGAFDEWWEGSGFYKFRETAMAAWEARACLNGKAVSEGLLRGLVQSIERIVHDERVPNEVSQEVAEALILAKRALLDEGKEDGHEADQGAAR